MTKHASRFAASAVALLGAAGITLLACADSTTNGAPHDDAGFEQDSRSPLDPPHDDASADARDAGDAATTDADSGAQARSCTDEAWCQTPLPPDQTLVGVWSDGPGRAWAISEEGHVLRYDGGAWTVAMSTTGALQTVWGRSATDLWVGGEEGIWHGEGPDAASISFTRVDLGEADVQIASIWGSPAGELWAVGRHSTTHRGRALVLPAGETAWMQDPVSARSDISEMRTVWGTADGDLWVIARGGSSDRILHRRVAGQASPLWVDEDPYKDRKVSEPAASFAGLGSIDDNVWIFGKVNYANAMYWVGDNDPAASTVAWSRSNWVGMLNTMTDVVNRFAVWGTSASDLWTIGERGRIQHWDGVAWRTAHITLTHAPVMPDLHAMWGRSNDDIWVVGDQIALHKVSAAEAQGAK